MTFKIGDVLELEDNVFAIVYGIESNDSQILYKVRARRDDNKYEFTKEIGYDYENGVWMESRSGLFGGKFWGKSKHLPSKVSGKSMQVPKYNLFVDQESSRED